MKSIYGIVLNSVNNSHALFKSFIEWPWICPWFLNTLFCGMFSVYTSNLPSNKLCGLVGSTILFIIYYK